MKGDDIPIKGNTALPLVSPMLYTLVSNYQRRLYFFRVLS